MQENDKFFDTKQYKVSPKMEIPTTKYLADYLYVVHEDVPFRYYRKVSDGGGGIRDAIMHDMVYGYVIYAYIMLVICTLINSKRRLAGRFFLFTFSPCGFRFINCVYLGVTLLLPLYLWMLLLPCWQLVCLTE